VLNACPDHQLKAKVAPEEDKQWLAGALRQISTGSLEGNVVKLSVLVDE